MKSIITILISFLLTISLSAQPQLPIDFESSTITYEFSDFDGGVASVIDNPQPSGINTSSKVGQMVKNVGQTFGGSTLALDGAIDFGDNNAIKMKVFANRTEAPVLFKLEGPVPVEVSMNTTVANEWEELTFSFAGLTGGTYTAITIIYDLGVVGDGSADFTLLFDDMELTTISGGISFPIDFESADETYPFADFDGGVVTVIDNPQSSGINTSTKVGQMIKFDGAVFGGSTLPLGGAIDFGDNNAIKMKVFANRVDAPVLFKLEGPVPAEVSMNTTVANEWEELTFSFAGLTGGVYTAITIIYDLGVVGDGSADFTLLFDDIELTNVTGGISLPIDFESADVTYPFADFDGGVATVIDNPQSSGINTSAKVGQMVKFDGAVFGGSTLPLGDAIDFGDNNAIKMKVFANRVDAPILFKLEGPIPAEVSMNTTVANEWEELTFNFTGLTGGVYTAITIIYDLGVVGDGSADFTFLFDDIELTTVSGTEGVALPIDFESADLTYSFADFEGGVATVIDNPEPSGINTSSKVGQMVKNEGQDFGGSTLALASPVIIEDNTSISMKVYANRVGAPVLFKLEGATPIELSMNTTVANEWEELDFDFSGLTPGMYTGITIIYDLGTVGDGGPDFTLLFDDIIYTGTSTVVDLEELAIDFYPNPVKDQMTVKAEEDIDTIAVYNLSGQQVLFVRPAGQVINLDLSSLRPGAYFVKMGIDGKKGTAKIIKQ